MSGPYKVQEVQDVWVIADSIGKQISPRWMSTKKEAQEWCDTLAAAYHAGFIDGCTPGREPRQTEQR